MRNTKTYTYTCNTKYTQLNTRNGQNRIIGMRYNVILHTSRTAKNRLSLIDNFNLGNDEQSTMAGTEIDALTVLAVNMSRRIKFSHCALHSLYGCSLVTDNGVKVKYLLITITITITITMRYLYSAPYNTGQRR